jgi:hypothetical protein
MFRADTPGTCADPDPDKGCTFSDNAIATGVDRAVAAGARVINLSLGGSSANSVLRGAIQRATAAGVVIIVSAGNDGDSTEPDVDPNNPDPLASSLRLAGNGNVIIAGSSNESGLFSAFSNRAGTEATWFLTAIGERVCCVYENGVLKITTDANGDRFQHLFSGTSFAAPQIAGAAALLLQAFPNLTASQVVDLLLRNAREAGDPGTDTTYGRGLLDVGRAFAPQGTTRLATSPEALPLGDTSVVTSGPMGDAGQQGELSAVVLDAYQRAYQTDLGSRVRGAQVPGRLGAALTGHSRNLNIGVGKLAMAFTVDARGRVAQQAFAGALRLSQADAEAARVLAMRIVAETAPGTKFGFAYRQGADGLVAQLQGRREPAFLVAGSPLDDYGLIREDETALALRHELGPWGVTVSTDHTRTRTASAMRLTNGTMARDLRDSATRLGIALDRRFGEVDLALGATWLDENRTFLGARTHDGLGAGGADSLFLDASAGWSPAVQWRFGADFRRAYTAAHGGGAVTSASRLTSTAWSFDVARHGLLQSHDSLGFRLSQPLRVDSGGLVFALPVDYDYATLTATLGERLLSLSPSGRERVAELAWRGTLWDGSAMASVFYRVDPGHYASLPDDRGVAFTWSRKF